jgi:hypothetical protein
MLTYQQEIPDPKSLTRTKEGIPRCSNDYIIALKSDAITRQA